MSPRGAVYHGEVRQRDDDTRPGPEGMEQHHTPQNLKSMNPSFLEFSISYFYVSYFFISVWDTPLSFHLSDCIDDVMLLPVKCSHVLPLPGLSLEKPAPFRSFQRTILLESIFEISLRPTFLKWPIISEVSPSCWFSRGVLWFTYAGYYEESHNSTDFTFSSVACFSKWDSSDEGVKTGPHCMLSWSSEINL